MSQMLGQAVSRCVTLSDFSKLGCVRGSDVKFRDSLTGILFFWTLHIPWLFPRPFKVKTLGLAVTLIFFRTFPVLGYFWTLNSSTDTNSGVHQNACRSPCSITSLYLTLPLLPICFCQGTSNTLSFQFSLSNQMVPTTRQTARPFSYVLQNSLALVFSTCAVQDLASHLRFLCQSNAGKVLLPQ